MNQHQQLFEAVRTRTGMYLMDESYATVAAFVQGYDCAHNGGLLTGFREWLVLRLKGEGANLGWEALVLDATWPDAGNPQAMPHESPEANRMAVDMLFKLIAEFDEVRYQRGGLQAIFVAFDDKFRSRTAKIGRARNRKAAG